MSGGLKWQYIAIIATFSSSIDSAAYEMVLTYIKVENFSRLALRVESTEVDEVRERYRMRHKFELVLNTLLQLETTETQR